MYMCLSYICISVCLSLPSFLGLETREVANVTMVEWQAQGPPQGSVTFLRSYPVQYFLHERTTILGG